MPATLLPAAMGNESLDGLLSLSGAGSWILEGAPFAAAETPSGRCATEDAAGVQLFISTQADKAEGVAGDRGQVEGHIMAQPVVGQQAAPRFSTAQAQSQPASLIEQILLWLWIDKLRQSGFSNEAIRVMLMLEEQAQWDRLSRPRYDGPSISAAGPHVSELSIGEKARREQLAYERYKANPKIGFTPLLSMEERKQLHQSSMGWWGRFFDNALNPFYDGTSALDKALMIASPVAAIQESHARQFYLQANVRPGGGVPSRIPLKATLSRDAAGRIESVSAVVKIENLHGGTPTTNAARAIARPDDAGHIIARLLGGRGGATSGNVMAQLSAINRGPFREFEKSIASQVAAGKGVMVEIKLIYPDATTLRPSGISYTVTVDGVTKTVAFPN